MSDQNEGNTGAEPGRASRVSVVGEEGAAARPAADASAGEGAEGGEVESVEAPAKVLRIGSMTKQLLDEVRQAPLDVASRARLKEIYETSVRELSSALSPDLRAELDRMALPFDSEVPSESELRIVHAQLLGWLEGLFQGIQATLFAQQMAARSQLEEMRRGGRPQGALQPPPVGLEQRPGQYL
jgi:hypothetical protein